MKKRMFGAVLAAGMMVFTLSLTACSGKWEELVNFAPSESKAENAGAGSTGAESASAENAGAESTGSHEEAEAEEISGHEEAGSVLNVSLKPGAMQGIAGVADFSLVSITTTDVLQATMQSSTSADNENVSYIDVVFDVKNTGMEKMEANTFMEFTAESSSGTTYGEAQYTFESEDFTVLSPYRDLESAASGRFHAVMPAPASKENLTLYFDVGGSVFSCAYQVGTEVKELSQLNVGDTVESSRDVASMKLISYEFSGELLPSDTTPPYNYLKPDKEGFVFLILQYEVTNHLPDETNADALLKAVALSADGQCYTGRIVQESSNAKSFDQFIDIAPSDTALIHYIIEVPESDVGTDLDVRTLLNGGVFHTKEYQFTVNG